MWLIRAALRRPITILVAVIAVALTAVFAVSRMRADIFPDLNLPVIYVAQPYGGLSPAQMEGYLVYYYEYHFLYINGIESVESKSIQNTGLLKLTFHPGTDMAQARAVHVGDRLRERLRHVGAGMKGELEHPGVLDRLRFDALDAVDIQEVVLVVIHDVPFHLRRAHAAVGLRHVNHGQVEVGKNIGAHPADGKHGRQRDRH